MTAVMFAAVEGADRIDIRISRSVRAIGFSVEVRSGIIFNDGTTLSAGPSPELELREFVFDPASAKYAFSMSLRKGTLPYSSGKLVKLASETVKLDTPRATIAGRFRDVQEAKTGDGRDGCAPERMGRSESFSDVGSESALNFVRNPHTEERRLSTPHAA